VIDGLRHARPTSRASFARGFGDAQPQRVVSLPAARKTQPSRQLNGQSLKKTIKAVISGQPVLLVLILSFAAPGRESASRSGRIRSFVPAHTLERSYAQDSTRCGCDSARSFGLLAANPKPAQEKPGSTEPKMTPEDIAKKNPVPATPEGLAEVRKTLWLQLRHVSWQNRRRQRRSRRGHEARAARLGVTFPPSKSDRRWNSLGYQQRQSENAG